VAFTDLAALLLVQAGAAQAFAVATAQIAPIGPKLHVLHNVLRPADAEDISARWCG